MKLSKSKAFVVQEGKCPESGQSCEFKISTEKIIWLHKYGPDDKFYNIQNLPFAVNHPNAIFKGLKRDGHDNSYCYVASPVRRFVGDTASKSLSDEWVFLVFVSQNLEVFDWRFERAGQDHKLPENHETRFTTLIWENKR
jgi:hypothetical protein